MKRASEVRIPPLVSLQKQILIKSPVVIFFDERYVISGVNTHTLRNLVYLYSYHSREMTKQADGVLHFTLESV